jgi:hypothetical protein
MKDGAKIVETNTPNPDDKDSNVGGKRKKFENDDKKFYDGKTIYPDSIDLDEYADQDGDSIFKEEVKESVVGKTKEFIEHYKMFLENKPQMEEALKSLFSEVCPHSLQIGEDSYIIIVPATTDEYCDYLESEDQEVIELKLKNLPKH